MTRPEENKFSTCRTVLAVLDENQSLVATIPALAAAVSMFRVFLTDIPIRNMESKTSVSGKTKAKNIVKGQLIEMTIPLANSVKAFASRNNNEELKAKSKLTKSKLKVMRTTDLISTAEMIHGLLNTNISVLGDFGVTAAKATALLDKIAEYKRSLSTKDTGFSLKTATHLTLKQLFREADKVLKEEIDSLMENFKADNKLFYDEYQSARGIKDLGLGHNGTQEPPAK
jgi:hypothetical protein